MKIRIAHLAFLASTIALIAACNKGLEQDIPEVIPSAENTIDIIHASIIDETVRTAYNEDTGDFTWSTSDEIIVMAQATGNANNQKCFTYSTSTGLVTNNGKDASFTGSIESGYEKTSFAAYPTSLKSNNVDSGYGGAFVKLPSSVPGTLASTILIGVADGDLYKFNTGASVFKITIANIPAYATEVRLVTSDKANYPLDGDFTLEVVSGVATLDFAHYHNEWSSYDKGYQKVDISALGYEASKNFFFNVPVGTYDANVLSVQLLKGSKVIFEKTIKKSITTVRNELLSLPTLTVDDWVSLGTAKFYDKGPSSNWDAYYHADVTLQQNAANTNQYRLVNPYSAYKTKNGNLDEATSDEYLVFTVDPSTDKVTFEKHATGLVLSSHPIVIQHPTVDGKWDGTTADASYNKVWQKDGSGNPLIVQLAPFYCYSDNSNGWSRHNYNHCIEIIFPDYSIPTDVDIFSDSIPTDESIHITVSGTNISKAKVSANRFASFSSGMSSVFDASTGTTYSGYSGTGYYTRQFAIQGYNSDGTEIFHNWIEKVVYSLSTSDAEKIIGKYTHTVESSCIGGQKTETPAPAQSSIELIVSTNAFAGHVMMSSFDGTAFTNALPAEYELSSGVAKLTFKNADLWKTNNRYLYTGSSPHTNNLVIQFVDSSSMDKLYVTTDFQYAHTNVYPPTWYYWYRGGSSHVYTQVTE